MGKEPTKVGGRRPLPQAELSRAQRVPVGAGSVRRSGCLAILAMSHVFLIRTKRVAVWDNYVTLARVTIELAIWDKEKWNSCVMTGDRHSQKAPSPNDFIDEGNEFRLSVIKTMVGRVESALGRWRASG